MFILIEKNGAKLIFLRMSRVQTEWLCTQLTFLREKTGCTSPLRLSTIQSYDTYKFTLMSSVIFLRPNSCIKLHSFSIESFQCKEPRHVLMFSFFTLT